MAEFRLTQISDTHLSRDFAKLTDNFDRVREHINASRPDLVINSGDVSWDGPVKHADLEFARELHTALPVDCRYLPGNHDIGDNPTLVGIAPSCVATEERCDAFVAVFKEDRWQFEAAGWRSEEHTSELQSHVNVVCRLLLEKKNARPSSKISSSLNCRACMCPILGVLGVIHCACSFLYSR